MMHATYSQKVMKKNTIYREKDGEWSVSVS